MKTLIKTALTLGTYLLFAANAWALPMTGDIVKMSVDPGANYGMKLITPGAGSSSTAGDFYNTFCVEYTEYFHNNYNYRVESVSLVATLGGTNLGAPAQDPYSGRWGDPISQRSIWLYASYFDGVFSSVATGQTLVNKVQNAIWYEEDEQKTNAAKADYDALIALAYGNFTVTGWDIKVVNIVNATSGANDYFKQSQLTGSRVNNPVPEPATMMLFGLGLLGLAGIGRKKQNN